MVTAATKPVISAVYRIVFYQFLIIAGFVLILSIVKNRDSGLSALAGGLAYGLPTFIFTRGIAACSSARKAGHFMMAFFGGEVFKLALSGALFLFAVTFLHRQLVDAVMGLLVGIVAFWVASIACLYRSEALL